MDFDCWTGIKIGEKSYIIAEKIRYKEKTSDDVWTEYGLITEDSDARLWLSIAEGGLSCSLSSPVGNRVPKGYRLHDSGTEVVTGVWGDTDASVGDETKYEQYESADGQETFFVEHWNGRRSSSGGRKIAAGIITADTDMKQHARGAFLRTQLRDLTVHMGSGLAAVAIVLFIMYGIPDLDARDWHDFRRFVNMPYALHERLADAPYYQESAEEGGARIYTAHIDAGSAALDLVEGVDGRVQDAYEDLHDAEHPIIVRTQAELARITASADGTARIVLIEAPPDAAPAAEKLQRSCVLMRYGEVVRTGDQRGRMVVAAEQDASGTVAPSAAPAGTASNAAPAPPADAPVPTTPASEDAQRRTRHLAH